MARFRVTGKGLRVRSWRNLTFVGLFVLFLCVLLRTREFVYSPATELMVEENRAGRYGAKPIASAQWCGPLPCRQESRVQKVGRFACDEIDAQSPALRPDMGAVFHLKGNRAIRGGLQGPGAEGVVLPFMWFTSPYIEPLEILGPYGVPLSLKFLGRFLGSGDFVFQYQVRVSGQYRIRKDGHDLVKFFLHPESTICPEQFAPFSRRYKCSEADKERVQASLEYWPHRSITREQFTEQGLVKLEGSQYLVHVAIVDNQLHYRNLSKRCPWWPLLSKLFLSLLRKVQLPDIEFYIHGNDVPMIPLKENQTPPVLSYASSPAHLDVLYPHPTIISDLFSGRTIKLAAEALPWTSRRAKAYFRGSNAGYFEVKQMGDHMAVPRWRAAVEAQRRPDFLDIRVSPKHEGAIDKAVLQELANQNLTAPLTLPNITILTYFKYMVDVDGNGPSGRSAGLLALGSVLLKHQSPYLEYYSSLMRPCHHFLQVDQYMGDLADAVDWAQANDLVAQQISFNGFLLSMERLRAQDVYCWMALLLRELASKLAFIPKVDKNMKPELQPRQNPRLNRCQI